MTAIQRSLPKYYHLCGQIGEKDMKHCRGSAADFEVRAEHNTDCGRGSCLKFFGTTVQHKWHAHVSMYLAYLAEPDSIATLADSCKTGVVCHYFCSKWLEMSARLLVFGMIQTKQSLHLGKIGKGGALNVLGHRAVRDALGLVELGCCEGLLVIGTSRNGGCHITHLHEP